MPNPSRSADDARLLARFGRHVRVLRTAAGLTQEQLGFSAGLAPTYISSLERGERNVAVLALCRLAHALAVEPGQLLATLADPAGPAEVVVRVASPKPARAPRVATTTPR